MTERVSQKARFGLLAVDVILLLVASRIGFGQYWPSNDDRGIWFYSALLGLLLGRRLDTPFFVTPADVVLYAAPAGVALLLANSWAAWPSDVRVGFGVALGYCALCLSLGVAAMLTHGLAADRWQKASDTLRVLAETLGSPRIIYSVVVGFALIAFHRDVPREFAAVAVAWLLTAAVSPVEFLLALRVRLKRVLHRRTSVGQDGEVIGFQTPGLLVIRQAPHRTITPGSMLAIRDPLGAPTMAVALDSVGRDEGLIIRALEVARDRSATDLQAEVALLGPNGVACVDRASDGTTSRIAVGGRETVVGLVAPDSTTERLYFEVVADDEIEEGRLVQVAVRGQPVLYQIVNGLTREELVRQRSTHGFARAQAQKVGTWDAASERFVVAKWMPRPNAPVYLVANSLSSPKSTSIGHFPGTDFAVRLRSVSELVTHNTAILGILGVGKSSLALELVERVLAAGIKVIVIDVTGEYESALSPFMDPTMQQQAEAALETTTVNGKTNYQQNVEEGGSREAFSAELQRRVSSFVEPSNTSSLLLIINPARFAVWRQDSKMFNNKASMASVTPAEVTQLVSDAALAAVTPLGTTTSARLCMVYEEAHVLVPEWNSTVGDGDKSAANGTARAILQGRKYGLGCMLITQRTANVTKTILNQCNTVFAMRTYDDTGKGFLANYVGAEYAAALPSIAERHAVVFGRASNCTNPVLVRLNDRDVFLAVFRQPLVPLEGPPAIPSRS